VRLDGVRAAQQVAGAIGVGQGRPARLRRRGAVDGLRDIAWRGELDMPDDLASRGVLDVVPSRHADAGEQGVACLHD
jgi:hypothetical protein